MPWRKNGAGAQKYFGATRGKLHWDISLRSYAAVAREGCAQCAPATCPPSAPRAQKLVSAHNAYALKNGAPWGSIRILCCAASALQAPRSAEAQWWAIARLYVSRLYGASRRAVSLGRPILATKWRCFGLLRPLLLTRLWGLRV